MSSRDLPHLFTLYFLMIFSTISIVESQLFNNSITAAFVFGDSTVDPGNNNVLKTPIKCNYPPYGMDFKNNSATGRFSDGILLTDMIASYVGIKELMPPYLDNTLSLEELMTGVSFASGGSGFDPLTAKLTGVLNMEQQLDYFREYKAKLESSIGTEGTKSLVANAAFVISAGTVDIVINYYGTPFRQKTYNITTYSNFLLQNAKHFIQSLRDEGAQLIGITGLPPLGCLPLVITFHSTDEEFHSRHCRDYYSSIAVDFNHKLQDMVKAFDDSADATIVYVDVYQRLADIIQNPSQFGFDVVNVGCCGTGLLEVPPVCNPKSPVCSNPSKYVFFDSVHPTEAAYTQMFQSLRPLIDGFLRNRSSLAQT